MVALAAFARVVPGRRADERVVRLEPRASSTQGTLALVERLGRELVDRRMKIPAAWDGAERRAPRKKAESRAAA